MKITVFYDGACPLCVREVARWQHARFQCRVEWFDITGQDEALIERGIDPQEALLELHAQIDSGEVFRSIESYALLLSQLKAWAWLGWLMRLPGIKHILKVSYDWMTRVRLKREGRLPERCSNNTCKK